MKITKNSKNEKIIDITELNKDAVVYVKKDGCTLFNFVFNNVTNYDGNIGFYYNSQTILSLFHSSNFIKHKLRFNHQNDSNKFYELEI